MNIYKIIYFNSTLILENEIVIIPCAIEHPFPKPKPILL